MAIALGATLSEEAQTKKISLNAGKPSYPDKYAQDLGNKYSIALGDLSPGSEAMTSAIHAGAEDRYRYLLGQKQIATDENARLEIIKQMAGSGQPVTPDDLEVVKGLSHNQMGSPDLPTILEQEYARKAVNLTSSMMDEDTNVLKDAMSTDPESAMELMDRSQWSVARSMILDNTIQHVMMDSEFNGPEDVPGQAWAWAQSLVPFWQDFNVGNAVPDSDPNTMLVGQNLTKAVNYMWGLPPAEFKQQLDRIQQEFMGRGDFLGLQRVLNAFKTYSRSDAVLDNFMQGVDVASSLPIAKFTKALAGATKAAVNTTEQLAESAVLIGRDAKAAESLVQKAMLNKTFVSSDLKDLHSIENFVPSEARPHQTWTGVPKLAPAAVTRLEKAVLQQEAFVSQALSEPNLVDRLDPNQMAAAFDRAQSDLTDMFYHDRYQMVDIVRTPADNVQNIGTITARFGQKNGEFFTSERQAKNAAGWVGLKTNDYLLKPMPGGRWTVEVTRPVREDGLRAVDIETTHKTPDNWQNKFLDYLRTPDDKLSKAQVESRAVVVSSAEHLSSIIEGIGKPIGKLGKKDFTELERALDHNRTPDLKTGNTKYFADYGEMEQFWQDQFGHLPTETQYEAYRASVNLSDLDWTIRNQDMFLQKMRLGLEEISFKFDGIDFDVPLEGRVIDNIPPVNQVSRSNYRVAVMQNGKLTKEFSSRYPKLKTLEMIDELLADGYKVVNVSGLFKHGEKSYQYIVIRDFKRNALNPNQLAYNPGHKIEKYNHYLKQPIIKTDEDGITNYYGDRAFANARSEQEGVELAKRFEQFRQMAKRNDPNTQTWVRDNLPVSYERLQKDIANGAFDLEAPVHYTPSGSSTRSRMNVTDREKFDDYTSNEHNPSYKITGKFIGDKDTFDLPTYTVEQGITHQFKGQKYLNPFEALSEGLNNAVQVRVMNDYRTKSAEDFIREFGNLLDGTSEEFRNGSIEFLYNPKYLNGADPVRVSRAESVRNSILGLLNYKTFVEKAVDVHKERVVQSVRNMFGNKVADFVSDTALPKIKNADVWLRSVGFHTKLGLFNPKQLFLQASAAVNVVSIAGKSGIKAAGNASQIMLAHQFTNDPARLAKIAKTAVGFKPEEFLEMVDAFKRSGFSRVGQSTSYMDMMAGPAIRSGKLKQILDVGARPFNMGEYFSRSMGWSAAYDEWKLANPSKHLDRAGERTILARAQLLTGNMMRQSNARWQKGYLSIVTQFFGAQARLTEQMLSGGLLGNGRLTRAEKARLFLGMSTLYGMPVGLGMTVGVAPVRDMLRDWLAEQNVTYDNTLAEPFIDGFASTLVEYLTGGDFTISEKYGLGGIPTVYDLMKGDSTLTDLLMGASGGILTDTMGDTQPFWSWLGSVSDLNDQTYYQITPAELFDPLRNVTTVNSVVKLWEAANIQKWMSRNGTVLTDISDTEAIISSIFGVDPERVSDTYNKSDALATWAEHETKERRTISTDLVRAIQAFKTDQDDIGDLLMDRSRKSAIRLGYDSKQFNRLLQDAIQQEGFDDLITEKWNKKALERQLKGN